MLLAIIDDEPAILRSLARMASRLGVETRTFDSAEGFLAASIHPDLILTDVRLPGMTGAELLQQLRTTEGAPPVALMSAYGSLDTAMQTMAEGAMDYLAKPITPQRLQELLAQLASTTTTDNSLDIETYAGPERQHNLIGCSPNMQALFAFVDKVAPYDATVLLQGESGTGKERIARAIHGASPRADRAFVSVNCGAIPESLMEAELFGAKKGAYTGADRDRPGVFGEADQGTLFLDEIGDLPLHLQVKLLRALQEGEIRPVGSSQSIPINVRVIAASLHNINKLVQEGKFREDLYFRLNIMEVRVPALRERRSDIRHHAASILLHLKEKYGKPVRGIDAGTMKFFEEYNWPGNVRQLENILERAYIMAEGEWISREAIQLEPGRPEAGNDTAPADNAEILPLQSLSIKKESARLEEHLIRQALQRTGGNQRKAAEILEISPRALIYKIKAYGLKQS